MPSLSSFSSTPYTTESRARQLITGFVLGSTYNTGFTYSGGNTPASDPGGLFGWLVYSRLYLSSPPIGTTADTYIEYLNPGALVSDLNKLSGSTYAMISPLNNTNGSTFSLFKSNGNGTVSGQTSGTQFLQSLSYLAYGGRLVLAGTTAGLSNYQTQTNRTIEALMGVTANSDVVRWVETNPYVIGVFPSVSDGNGYTAANYDTLFQNSSSVSLTNSSSPAYRIFNVYGQKTVSNFNTSLLETNTTITYTHNAVPDVCGFLARAKDRGELYLTNAGVDRGFALNGVITNPISWSNTTIKNTLKNNRVNYFINYSPVFLGLDLVGATASVNEITVNERIGPAQMKTAMDKDITNIGMKYLYDINNEITRTAVTTEILSYLQQYSNYVDTTKTQVICNSSNNTDNSSSLNISVAITPLLGTTSFVVNVNLSAA